MTNSYPAFFFFCSSCMPHLLGLVCYYSYTFFL